MQKADSASSSDEEVHTYYELRYNRRSGSGMDARPPCGLSDCFFVSLRGQASSFPGTC